jgi:hypothetical protein
MTDLEHIKSTINIADLVGQVYELTGRGRYLKTRQHDSLVVDTQRQTYYWNSRGESGDAVDWVGRYCLNYNGQWHSSEPGMFKEAVIWLARYANLPEPQFKPEDVEVRARRLSRKRLMAQAADYYQTNLQQRNIQAYQYALKRGFTPETIERACLGYADGKLWQAIPEQDRPLAVELGLIYRTERGHWKDAIYAGNLVYTHYHRGQVEYLAGRSITDKRHCNIRAPKRIYWAAWPGYGGPLIICEGQADAISLAQLGVSALALCGVNLADFDLDLVTNLFNAVYYWPDYNDASDVVGKIARTIGPLFRLLQPPELYYLDKSPIKDANDMLRVGATATDLACWIKEAPTFLEYKLAYLVTLPGADYDELETFFGHLVGLDNFKLTRYRARICKRLKISQSDFARMLRAARGVTQEEEEEQFPRGGQYDVIDGWTVLKTVTETGRRDIKPLASGSCKIAEIIVNDDGSNDPQIEYLMIGELATGRKLPRVTIPAAEFDSMRWIAKQWGPEFIIQAGRATADHFRAAIQHLSGSPHRRIVYNHTGWRTVDDKRIFLTSAGALGTANGEIQVDLKMGRPDTNMVRYRLPQPEEITQAMQTSLNFWHIADSQITIPLWAAMYLAPLTEFITVDFGLWLHGQTGSMKSSIAAACLSHFGQWQGEGKGFLPANFESTANSILMNAFQAKNVPLVVDDFAPGATIREIRERDATASRLLRSVGNKAARGRMRDGRRFQADFPPRCLAIITAEDLPQTASIMARGIGIRVFMPPKGTPERKSIEQRLSQVQAVDSYQYPHAMAGYILWIQRHWDTLATDLPKMATGYRDEIKTTGHSRLPDAFGKLMAAIDTALYFALDCGALTHSQATDKKGQAMTALTEMMSEHGEAVSAVDATHLFREILQEYIDSRLWYLAPYEGPIIPPDNAPLGAQCVGYQNDRYIYLLPKTVKDIIQDHQRTGSPFPVGKNTLYKRLQERGWLVKPSSTEFIPALNTSPRVLTLYKNKILEK